MQDMSAKEEKKANPIYRILAGPCKEILKTLEDESVDSIVCDPPYEIGFMGNKWDSSGIAYDVEMWKECLRVLKPGGYLLSFGATRTYHRMACAVEDAGFEIRDQIDWKYGSGFPKGGSVSKMIAKAKNSPDKVEKWEGWASSLKPAHEPIVVARKPFEGPLYQNVLEHGTGGMNIDACRNGETGVRNNGRKVDSEIYGKFGPTERVDYNKGRWPANVVLTHSVDCKVVDQAETKAYIINRWTDGAKPFGGGAGHKFETHQTSEDGTESYAVYDCAEDCPARLINIQSSNDAARFFNQLNWSEEDFEPFMYLAKANKKERRVGIESGINDHPTVKPVKLMEWLVTLVTPPGGTVLDQFMGSGSTGVAALNKGFNFIGIELMEEYVSIAEQRLDHALKNQKEKR